MSPSVEAVSRPGLTPQHPPLRPRPPVNLRSVTLGMLGVLIISSISAYNDWVLVNTYLTGNYLPVGLLLYLLLLLLLINAPLRRWWPDHALDSRELAVVMCMVLVSCAIPSSGLMRYMPTSLVGVWYHAGQNADYRRFMLELNLPQWIFPQFQSSDRATWSNDPVIMNYYLRAPDGQGVPWSAWLTPALTWGIFLAALGTAVICTAVIVRRQWVENERLPFPLAEVYASLIESPAPGRTLNPLLGSRSFWIAFAAVFVIHGLNAMNRYFPKTWPQFPLKYDLSSMLTGEPWRYLDYAAPRGTLYFSIVGIAFFLQSKVGFSLWFFYILFNITRMFYGTWKSDYTGGMQQDQLTGAAIVYAAAILWVGRAHFAMVLRHMFRRYRPGEPTGRYLSYRAAGWGLAGSLIVAAVWLKLAGASAIGAVVLVLLLMMMVLVVARIIAETGMIFARTELPISRFWLVVGTLPDGLARRTTMETYFYSALFSLNFTHDTREALPVYATHALRVADQVAYADDARTPPHRESQTRRTGPFLLALAAAIVVAFVVSGAAMLKVEYSYAATIDRLQVSPINYWGITGNHTYYVMDATRDYRPPRIGPQEPHSRTGYFLSGVVIAGLLSFLRLRFMAWPLHPVGLLLAYSYPMRMVWFSVMVGWIIKVMVVRFGGVQLIRAAKPFFIGLIVGEAGAAAFWLVVTLVLNALGLEFHAIQLLPA
jgi:hypothetical protein